MFKYLKKNFIFLFIYFFNANIESGISGCELKRHSPPSSLQADVRVVNCLDNSLIGIVLIQDEANRVAGGRSTRHARARHESPECDLVVAGLWQIDGWQAQLAEISVAVGVGLTPEKSALIEFVHLAFILDVA